MREARLIPEEKALSPEELETQEAAELPVREAMSLISTGGETLFGDFGSLDGGLGLPATDDAGGLTDAGTTDDLTGTASDPPASTGTDGMASGTDPNSGSVSEDDRSERFTQTDSASATS